MAATTTRYEKQCATCGKLFLGRHNSKYCCKRCRDDAILVRLRNKHVWATRTCQTCGKVFQQSHDHRSVKFCCAECQQEYRREYERKLYAKKRLTPGFLEQRAFKHKARRKLHRDEINEKNRQVRLNKQRPMAIALQNGTPIKNYNGNLRQDYKESLGIERLSGGWCKCLHCGKDFELKCNKSAASVYLDRRVKLGVSPCPFCGEAPTGVPCRGSRHSSPEYELQQLYPNFTLHNYHPDWMNGLELDLYDPVSKTALEYHGVKWHSGDKDRGLQKTKADLCEANGVHLIQLYDTEWLQKKDIVKDKLDAIFHKNMTRIFARKLRLSIITGGGEIRPFLDNNHIQGYAMSQWAVGLWNGLKLMAVCTFKYGTAYASGGQNAGTKKYWELNRYATKLGYSIVGGLSRCVKAFFRAHPEVEEVFSFADRRWTSTVRSAYSSSGFVEVEHITPNYQYTDRNPMHELKNKQKFRKSRIALEHPEIYSDDKTETQMATELGMFKIWDAGKIKYRIHR